MKHNYKKIAKTGVAFALDKEEFIIQVIMQVDKKQINQKLVEMMI